MVSMQDNKKLFLKSLQLFNSKNKNVCFNFFFFPYIYIYIYIKPDPLLVLSQKKRLPTFKTLNGHKIIEINVMNSFLFIRILYINRSNLLPKCTLRWGKLVDKSSLSCSVITHNAIKTKFIAPNVAVFKLSNNAFLWNFDYTP